MLLRSAERSLLRVEESVATIETALRSALAIYWNNPSMRLTRAELEAYRDAEVPDLIGPDVKLVFVGINPGLWTAATQTHFAHPTNRFYPALSIAGITPRSIDPGAGMTDDDRVMLIGQGIGITNVVRRATARADELSRDEMREGAQNLTRFVEEHQPSVVAVLGLTAYRQGFDRPKAQSGEQAEGIAGARLWVLPNPSSLNPRETPQSLAVAYAEPARVAGVLTYTI